jgi:hypothetical protein
VRRHRKEPLVDRNAGFMEARYECVPNIGPRGRRRRTIGAVFSLLVGIAATVAFTTWQASPATRLLVGVPFFLAALAYFQAREKT